MGPPSAHDAVPRAGVLDGATVRARRRPPRRRARWGHRPRTTPSPAPACSMGPPGGGCASRCSPLGPPPLPDAASGGRGRGVAGATRPGAAMLRDFLGREPNPDAYCNEFGIATDEAADSSKRRRADAKMLRARAMRPRRAVPPPRRCGGGAARRLRSA
eukprot:gene7527-59570_t